MTKQDLARAVAGGTGLPQTQAKAIVQRVLDGITLALLHEGRLELRDFGVFQVRGRRPRRARNPRTGQAVAVPARRVVTFRPGRAMAGRVGLLPTVPKRES